MSSLTFGNGYPLYNKY